MSDAEVLKTVAYALTPMLLLVIGWFLRVSARRSEELIERIESKVVDLDKEIVGVRKDIENISGTLDQFSDLRSEWYEMKQEVGQVLIQMRSIRATIEDVAVLKRDQATIWKRIDELKIRVRHTHGVTE